MIESYLWYMQNQPMRDGEEIRSFLEEDTENVNTIRKILDAHCILTTFYDGKLYAFENANIDSKFINVTNWSIKQIYDWLGY